MTIDIKFIRSLPRIRKKLTTGTMSVDDVVAMKDDFSKLAYFIIDQDRDKGKIDDEFDRNFERLPDDMSGRIYLQR